MLKRETQGSIKLYFHVINISSSKNKVKKFKKYLETCVRRFSMLEWAVGIDETWWLWQSIKNKLNLQF